MNRRNFLKNSALASSSLLVPTFLHALPGGKGSRTEKILVVIQLSGGNDGLNTLIPFRNDLYYQNRPRLAVPAMEVLDLNGELGLNPAMASIRHLYDQGEMCLINSVGYPNPDRSHFRSMDIWQSGSGSSEYWSSGWLGRYLDSDCLACEKPYHLLEFSDQLSMAVKGEQRNGFAMSDPKKMKRSVDNPFLTSLSQRQHEADHDDHVAYLYKVLIDTQYSAQYLLDQSKVYASSVSYPNTPFGRDLKQMAELITADSDIKVYYVSLGGFDTHANQRGRQDRLLQQYAEGLSAFVQDLKKNNLFQDTLILTFSEFGRRVQQNASGGTDHGTANNVFLMGGSLKKAGSYNTAPDLMTLDNGDLLYQVDFRQVYATILEKWLNADASLILRGEFAPMSWV
ncbi:MAG TPA: DUF1501 domain-containing protein [Saprospiraceae bacterium]|nr:DUF1501 domain-containing protein [Saprospiraceae bacterium]HMQ82278.1 DUF1501 domain-containing protein [Saprospiraceae bacterium]